MKKYILPILGTFLFVGCGGGSSTTDDTITTTSTDETTYKFIVENMNSSVTTTYATLKSKVTVDTKYGSKTLLVWVSDDSFGDSCTKSKCIDQTMIDELQSYFLQDGEGNDIYDWVTNVYGEEWGSDAHELYSNLIPQSDEINILLTDIDNDDSPNSGVMGYFYAQDNFDKATYPNSNEMIMFYVDSVMFANDENDGFWQKEMYSTLAHEFQHMIHFYQKRILKGIEDDTWVNEMLSETTEDLIATKIDHIGPRGVPADDGTAGEYDNTKGRYPLFNENNDISLTSWDSTLANYSNVNAFGTFLTRNYGGAKVLHDTLYNDKAHEDTLEYATGQDFGTLLQEWGEAVILSSIENPQDLPTYNFGEFAINSYDGIDYDLGSIDFFRYSPTPKLYDGNSFDHDVQPHSNLYYIIGQNLSGSIDIDITLDSGEKALLITKNDTDHTYTTQDINSGSHTIDLDGTKDVYLVITNTNASTTSSVQIDHNAKYITKESKSYKVIAPKPTIQKAPSFVTEFNNHIKLQRREK